MPPQPPQYHYAPPPKKGMPTWGWVLMGCLGIPLLLIPIAAAILFPVFAQAREKARQTSCLSNLKQQGIAIRMYAQDYDETLPPSKEWMDKLDPYVNNEKAFHCPSARNANSDNSKPTGYAMNAKLERKKLGKISTPEKEYLIFDADAPQRSFATQGLQFPAKPRHGQLNNVAFADGHVKSVKAGAAE